MAPAKFSLHGSALKDTLQLTFCIIHNCAWFWLLRKRGQNTTSHL